MGNIVDTVEGRIQIAYLTALDSSITPKIELVIRSINASSRLDASSVVAGSERGEDIGTTAPFGNVSEKNNTLCELNTNDATRNKNTDKVSEFLVLGPRYTF